jgi:hypothetical protein
MCRQAFPVALAHTILPCVYESKKDKVEEEKIEEFMGIVMCAPIIT